MALSYILIIIAVLVLLNTYPLVVSQNMVFRSKQTTMQSSVSVMVSALSGLDVLTEKNVAQAMTVAEEAAVSRVLVTDADGMVLYDDRETGGAVGRYALYTEITEALGGYDAFHSRYEDGAFRSRLLRRWCTGDRSSARCMPMSTIRSRRNCWVDCSKTCATYPW